MNKFFCKLLHQKHWETDERVIRVKVDGKVVEQTIGSNYWKCSKCGRRYGVFKND